MIQGTADKALEHVLFGVFGHALRQLWKMPLENGSRYGALVWGPAVQFRAARRSSDEAGAGKLGVQNIGAVRALPGTAINPDPALQHCA